MSAAAWRRGGATLPAVAALAGCLGSGNVVEVDGSNSMAPLAEAVAVAFASRGEEGRVVLRSSGTGGGFRRLCDREADIATASRPMSAKERDRCRERGVRHVAVPVARDGVAVVTHPKNALVACLGLAELGRLWAPGSEVATWRGLRPNLPAQAVRLHAPGFGSGTFDFFTQVVVGRTKASRTDYDASGGHGAVARSVAGDPWATGYMGYAHYVANREALRALQVDAGAGCVAPSPASFADGSYSPLVRELLLYVAEDALRRPGVARFASFFVSASPVLAPEAGYAALPAAEYARSRALLANAVRSAEPGGS